MIRIVNENRKVAERVTELCELTCQIFDVNDGRTSNRMPEESFQTALDKYPAVADAFTIAPFLKRISYRESALVRCVLCMMGIDPRWLDVTKRGAFPLAVMSTQTNDDDVFRIAMHTFCSFMPLTSELRELIEFANVDCMALLELDDEDDVDESRDANICKVVQPIADHLETHSFVEYITQHFDKFNTDDNEEELKYVPL